MSLIPVSSNQNWVVVLKDSTRKSLVFYNQASHELALVNDPREFSIYETYETQDNLDSNWEPNTSKGRQNSNELVSYNPSEPTFSQQTSLVSSEHSQRHIYSQQYGQLLEYGDYSQMYQPHNRISEYSSPTEASSVICPECGTIVSSYRLRRNSRSRGKVLNIATVHSNQTETQQNHTTAPAQSAGSTPQIPKQPEIVRDASYFRLLEGFTPLNEDQTEPDRESNPFGNAATISTSALSEGYFAKFFRVVAYLGRGSRGLVYLVEHLLDGYSLGLFALKKVPVGDDHKWLEKVLTEVNLLRLLSHPNLVNYNHMWLENAQMSRFSPKVPCAFILQEYCDGGTLEDYVNSLQKDARMKKIDERMSSTGSNKRFTKISSAQAKREKYKRAAFGNVNNISTGTTNNHDQATTHDNDIISEARLTLLEILSFSRDIFAGVAYLHRAQIIHRDLKPSNCLLLSDENQNIPNLPSDTFPPAAGTPNDGNVDLGGESSVPGLESCPSFTYEQRTHGPLPTVLVSDFGEGQREGVLREGTGATGTLEYCAPELVSAAIFGSFSDKNPPELVQFSRKTDMFSLGMILYFLIYSCLPYSSDIIDSEDPHSVEKLQKAVSDFEGYDETGILKQQKREDIPQELIFLLKGLLSRNSHERPEADECCIIIEKVLQVHMSSIGNQETNKDKDLELLDTGPEIYPSTKAQLSQPSRASIRLISDISIEDAQHTNYYPVYKESFYMTDKDDYLHESEISHFEKNVLAADDKSYAGEGVSTSSAVVPFGKFYGTSNFQDASDPFQESETRRRSIYNSVDSPNNRRIPKETEMEELDQENKASSSLVVSEKPSDRLHDLLQDRFRNTVAPRSETIIGHVGSADGYASSRDMSHVPSVTVSRQGSDAIKRGRAGNEKSQKESKPEDAEVDPVQLQNVELRSLDISKQLVPAVVSGQNASAPVSGHKKSDIFKFLRLGFLSNAKWSWKLVVMKSILFFTKMYILNRQTPNTSNSLATQNGENVDFTINQVLLLLCGIELPIRNVAVMVLLFVVHLVLINQETVDQN